MRVRNAAGSQTSVQGDLLALCGAPPADPDPAYTSAGSLVGGINLAWRALGAQAVNGDDNIDALFDGVVSPSRGLRSTIDDSVTVDLAGDEPATIAGILLNPQGRTTPAEYLYEFELLTSMDGETFTPVLGDKLAQIPAEQGFVFDAPVQARFAQLRLLSNHEDSQRIGLGEWKIVSDVNSDVPASDNGYDLAEPAKGGHVVYSVPLISNQQQLLTEKKDRPALRIDPVDQIAWVVGFHHDRAAQIERLEWEYGAAGTPEEYLEQVDVQVSVDSPVGPWESIATWTLDPVPDEVQTLSLDAPTWARYVRFVAPGRTERSTYAYPDRLHIYERPADGIYRSILGEYGHYRQEAVYELTTAVSEGATTSSEAENNDSQVNAQPLSAGEFVEGDVQIGVDEDLVSH